MVNYDASYVSMAEADSILFATLKSDPWFALTEEKKLRSLSHFSRMLDSYFDWNGAITSKSQDLRWPRTGVIDRDGNLIDQNTIPEAIKQAVVALSLAATIEETSGSTPGNLESVKVGPITLAFNTSESVDTPLIPNSIISMLSFLGSYSGPRGSDTAYNVKVLR